MRRRTSLVLLSAGLLVASLALPAEPARAGSVEWVVTRVELAFGEWSTCPTWEVGASCVFTQVIAAESRDRELNDFLDPARRGRFLHSDGPSLILRHYWFDVVEADGEPAARPTRESFGGVGTTASFPTSPGNPEVAVDTRLRGGTASATEIRMHTTDYSRPGEPEWWETAATRTRWVGTGDLDRVREGSFARTTGRIIRRETTTGWMRDVVASGSDSMVRDWGEFLGGYLFHGQQSMTGVYRGRSAGPVSSVLQALAAPGAPVVVHERSTSSYGEAAWTTCPAPKAGDRCRDVSLWFSSVTPHGGAPAQWAGLEIADYEVLSVDDGWVDFVLVRTVTTSGSPTALTAPRDLSGAALSVTGAEALSCAVEGDCVPARMSFTAGWSGTGPAERFSSHGMAWGDWGREWGTTQGIRRAATATAQVSGLPAGLAMNGEVGGTLRTASLTAARERHMLR